MKETESIEEFYNRVIILLNQMRLNGEVIEDRRVIEKILRSITRKFEYVVVAIEESKDLSELSLESFLGTLQSHELRMNQFESPSLEQAFQTQSTWQSDQHKDFQNKGKGRGSAKNLVSTLNPARKRI